MKILIAEDDVVTRKMLASLLTRWDFAVTTVGTGTEAWEMLQAEDAPNLVLLPLKQESSCCRRSINMQCAVSILHLRQLYPVDPTQVY